MISLEELNKVDLGQAKVRKFIKEHGVDLAKVRNVFEDGNGHLIVQEINGNIRSYSTEGRSFINPKESEKENLPSQELVSNKEEASLPTYIYRGKMLDTSRDGLIPVDSNNPKVRKHLKDQGQDTAQIDEVYEDGKGHLIVFELNGNKRSYSTNGRTFADPEEIKKDRIASLGATYKTGLPLSPTLSPMPPFAETTSPTYNELSRPNNLKMAGISDEEKLTRAASILPGGEMPYELEEYCKTLSRVREELGRQPEMVEVSKDDLEELINTVNHDTSASLKLAKIRRAVTVGKRMLKLGFLLFATMKPEMINDFVNKGYTIYAFFVYLAYTCSKTAMGKDEDAVIILKQHEYILEKIENLISKNNKEEIGRIKG